MATVIARPTLPAFETPAPDPYDNHDPVGMRIGAPIHIPFLKTFGVSTQLGTIWLGTWGMLSVAFFVAGLAVLTFAGIQQMQGNVLLLVKYFANVQIQPPEGLGMAPSLQEGGFWQINMLLWAAAVVCWAGRLYDRLVRFHWRPYLLFAWLSAILLTSTIWVFRPIAMGSWAEAPALGLNSDLDWAQNFSVLWGNLYYNPWHMLAIFFLLGSTMLWGMHGATILATASEGSHMEDAEIKDMHSGSHKSMLFWRWTMGFNANPKTIHDWLYWFSVGTVLASAIGIIVTGPIVKDWYVWGVDHGWVQQYGPITRSAINGMPHKPAIGINGSSLPGVPITAPGMTQGGY
jgi:photosynthetic reaction center M subunit